MPMTIEKTTAMNAAGQEIATGVPLIIEII
jgi:hypothetical protein